MGDSVHLSDIKLPASAKPTHTEDMTLVTVAAPTVVAEPEPAAEGDAAAEGEGEDKPADAEEKKAEDK